MLAHSLKVWTPLFLSIGDEERAGRNWFEMKPYTRQASVTWRGTHHRGRGVVTTPSAVLKRGSCFFGNGQERSGTTNPPELIASAHAGSFSMTLANELGEAGYRPKQIQTIATVTMEKMVSGWTMTQIHLDIVATVSKVAPCDFVDATLRAKENCPISRLLKANISMRAQLLNRPATTQKGMTS
jgi:lipoyl-dependent peroxiredoxin